MQKKQWGRDRPLMPMEMNVDAKEVLIISRIWVGVRVTISARSSWAACESHMSLKCTLFLLWRLFSSLWGPPFAFRNDMTSPLAMITKEFLPTISSYMSIALDFEALRFLTRRCEESCLFCWRCRGGKKSLWFHHERMSWHKTDLFPKDLLHIDI